VSNFGRRSLGRVHALVLQEIIASRKSLATLARERLLVGVQRQHVTLQVLRARKALRAARHRADVRAFPRLGRLGHPPSAALLIEMWDGHGRRDTRTAHGAGPLRRRCRCSHGPGGWGGRFLLGRGLAFDCRSSSGGGGFFSPRRFRVQWTLAAQPRGYAS